MDATYRADLKEFNELNFARFDAKQEQRLLELKAGLRTEFRTELHALKAKLIKWMFLFRAGTTLAGLLVR